jgi:hypothetical protein
LPWRSDGRSRRSLLENMGFRPKLLGVLVLVALRIGTNVSISHGSSGAGHGHPLVLVRLEPLVPVGNTNRD